jgi:hypothetical protein
LEGENYNEAKIYGIREGTLDLFGSEQGLRQVLVNDAVLNLWYQ